MNLIGANHASHFNMCSHSTVITFQKIPLSSQLAIRTLGKMVECCKCLNDREIIARKIHMRSTRTNTVMCGQIQSPYTDLAKIQNNSL